MRPITAALTLLLVSTSVFGAPRHEPVVIVTPPRDGSPLLTRVNKNANAVQTITRHTRPGTERFDRAGNLLIDDAEFIAVRTREPLPTLLVNPLETIDERTRDEIRRQFPYARRVDTITDDLRRAQRQYLRDAGVILTVRTFTNPRAERTRTSSPAPRVLAPDESVDATPSRVLPPDDSD